MSIHTVHIVPAEEQYSPSSQIIELAVLGDDTDQLVHETQPDGVRKQYTLRHARKLVLLSLSNYEEDAAGTTTKLVYTFPAIDLNDLLRALSSFGVGVQSFHVGEPPIRLPAPPEETDAA